MPDPLNPSVGWGVLHLFCALTPDTDAQAIGSAVKEAQAGDQQVVTFAVLGHKADFGFMALGPDLWRLRAFQAAVQNAGVDITYSYVSLTEVSEYAQGMPDDMKTPRLYPTLPPAGMRAFCFYPMTKRRDVDQNWYVLPYDQREDLMKEHGASGRKFRGRIVQLITGSTGIDDYEWGVSLFGNTPDDLKECVYTMRFDTASARYAEFGPFITGIVGDVDDVLSGLGVS